MMHGGGRICRLSHCRLQASSLQSAISQAAWSRQPWISSRDSHLVGEFRRQRSLNSFKGAINKQRRNARKTVVLRPGKHIPILPRAADDRPGRLFSPSPIYLIVTPTFPLLELKACRPRPWSCLNIMLEGRNHLEASYNRV